MSSGNHLADQGQREYEKRGECPSCHRGNMAPADWCNAWDHECDKGDCPVWGECNDIGNAIKCDKCGYISVEEL